MTVADTEPEVLGCAVYIDGVRFADGREGDDFLAPLALDGLTITWGRDSTVDQPQTATCTFEAMDLAGGRGFLEMLYGGAHVEVRTSWTVAEGEVEVETIQDPEWDNTDPGQRPGNVQESGGITARVVDTPGGHQLALTPPASNADSRVYIAPQDFTTDPTAWDMVPQVQNGSTWTYALDVLAPRGARISVLPVFYNAPDGVTIQTAPSSLITTFDSVGEPVHVEREVVLTVAAPGTQWLGYYVRIVNPGVRWNAWTPADDTWASVAPEGLTWADLGGPVLVDNASLKVLSPVNGLTNDALVFEGAITDLAAAWDETLPGPPPTGGGTRVAITAADFTAPLNNVYVGDDPWPVQPMSTRFSRVLTLANTASKVAVQGAEIDPDLGAINLGYQDIDNQSALDLLTSFADSVDGVLWPAAHVSRDGRRYFVLEDISKRASGYVMLLDPGSGMVIVDDAGTEGRIELSACDVLRDPVTFEQSPADVSTRVAVGWQEQTVDESGKPAPTDRTYELVDTEAEDELGGVYRLQVSTLLQDADDAADHAERKLRRSSVAQWRATGLTWDLDLTPPTIPVQTVAATMLDGTRRIGLPLLLTDLPAWTPSSGAPLPVYLEGGSYEFTGGRWVLALTVSNTYGIGGGAMWSEIPTTWTWEMYSPDVSWADIYAAAVEGT